MNDYSFSDYAKAEHADLRQLILAQARAGELASDTWKERFEALRKLFDSLLQTHRHCNAPCADCLGRRRTAAE
ncbi:hypothetical protein AURDEDRAFT_161637 [Auricularia subglabra TFB-10046 SS5]|nr:hypothetical protein AURDEDRAFT_161637 [Auricularia subglabra TFB-10046 SS5]